MYTHTRMPIYDFVSSTYSVLNGKLLSKKRVHWNWLVGSKVFESCIRSSVLFNVSINTGLKELLILDEIVSKGPKGRGKHYWFILLKTDDVCKAKDIYWLIYWFDLLVWNDFLLKKHSWMCHKYNQRKCSVCS